MIFTLLFQALLNVGLVSCQSYHHLHNNNERPIVDHDIAYFLNHTLHEIYDSKEDQGCYDSGNIISKKEDNWYFTTRNYKDQQNITFILNILCPEFKMMGNQIGAYFNEVACALDSGSHYVMLKKYPDSIAEGHKLFFDTFPTVILNPNFDSDRNSIIAKSKIACECNKFCWSESNAPWLNHIPWIVSVIRHALTVFVDAMNPEVLMPKLTNTSSSPIPAIPDVSIHYRCGDNLAIFKYGYGLLPYHAISPLIPVDAKYIYILTDNHDKGSNCHAIVDHLADYISVRFPDSIVQTCRGSDPLVDFVRLAYSKITICSASTFCFFAALANNGTAHFPITKLIASPGNASAYGSHFHWIPHPQVMNAVHLRPWHLIFFELEGRSITAADLEGQIVQGRGRSVFYVRNQSRHQFNSGDVFEALHFEWGNIWHIDDNTINSIPMGADLDYNSIV